MQRLILMIFAGVGLACTVTGKDDDSGTEPASSSTADTSAGPGAGSSSEGGGGTTDVVDPTSAGATTAETSAGPTSGPTSAESSSGPAETGTAETGPGEVSFTDVFEQIIMPNGCNAGYCHGGGAGGLDMTDEATTYANLVEVAAAAPMCDQSMRVVPGSLEESIVWYRVRPAAMDMGMPCAPKMPQGSMGLSEEQAQLMSDWIVGGALE